MDRSHQVAKVCDFGTSRSGVSNSGMTGNVGTVKYASPEVLQEADYDQLCDVYSFGILMYEVLFQKSAYEDANTFKLGIDVINGKRPLIPEDGILDVNEKRYIALMQKCWAKEPLDRPAFETIQEELETIQYFMSGASRR